MLSFCSKIHGVRCANRELGCSKPVLLGTGLLAMVPNPLGLCSLHIQPGRVAIVFILLVMGPLLGSRGTGS